MKFKNNWVKYFIIFIFTIIGMTSCSDKESEIEVNRKTVFWTIFDSLGANNQWQPTFAKLMGWQFYSALNSDSKHPISKGGTNSKVGASLGSLERALNLVKLKNKYPIDVVFFENVNDANYCDPQKGPSGNINDKPWMFKGCYTIPQAFESAEEAMYFINNDINSFLSTFDKSQRESVNVLDVLYKNKTTKAAKLSFTNKATQDGTFNISIGSNIFGISVTTKMSIQDIVEKVIECDFGAGWIDTDNGDGSVTFSYNGTTTDVVSFDPKNTGVKASVSEDYSVSVLKLFYTGGTDDEWEDVNMWKQDISLYSTYKGLFDYLKRELPNAKIYLVIPTYYGWDFSNTDESLFNASERNQRWLRLKEFWKTVMPVCGIEVLDIESNSDVTFMNASKYYNNNDVHPKQAGYEMWAHVLSNLLTE